MNKKITLFFCTYYADFDLLKRAIDSIYDAWDHSTIEEIVVILNDQLDTMEELTNILDGFSKSISIRLVHASTLNPIEQYDWHSQQALKLLVSEIITTDWYIIYDCKDFYLVHPKEKITPKLFFNTDGKAIDVLRIGPQTGDKGHYFIDQYQRAYNIWGLKFDPAGRHCKVTTPFICNTAVIRDLIAELKIKFPFLYELLFLIEINRQQYITEFTIISAYLEYKGLFDKLYVSFEQESKMHTELYQRRFQNKFLRRENWHKSIEEGDASYG